GPVPGATVIAVSSAGGQTRVTADASGHYTLNVAPDSYSLDVAFNTGGFSTQGLTVRNSFAVTQDVVADLTVPTVTWSAQVVDGDGTAVAGVTFAATAFARNAC